MYLNSYSRLCDGLGLKDYVVLSFYMTMHTTISGSLNTPKNICSWESIALHIPFSSTLRMHRTMVRFGIQYNDTYLSTATYSRKAVGPRVWIFAGLEKYLHH